MISKKTNLFASLAGIAVLLAVVSCGRAEQTENKSKPQQAMAKSVAVDSTKAVAVLYPTAESKVHGMVTFQDVPNGVRVTGTIEGLTPGKHGFHIHEYGDCSGSDGKSAGGHFNPTGMAHGAPGDSVRHVGDLGNIVADAQGKAVLNMVDSRIALHGMNSIIGRGVIVHSGVDDFTTQPTGNAGSRVACGAIGYAAEK